jgi:anti-sigma B factor antagonist
MGAITTLAVGGDLDVSATELLLARIEAEAAREPDLIVLDLSALSFIDSTGLRALLQAGELAADRGFELSIVRGQGQVARVMRITRLDEVLPLVDGAAAEVPAE